MEEFYTLLYSTFEGRLILVIMVITIAFILCYWFANSNKTIKDINLNKSTNEQSEVRVIINRRNGLKEHYIDEDNRFYTLNGKKITKPNINRIIYEDENYFFLLNCIKVYREVEEDDDLPDRVWEEYYAYVTLYDYNANEIFQEIIKIKFPKSYSDIDKEVLKEYNDNIKLFCNQYLYSKAGKKIIKLQGNEKISLEGENVIITLPDGEEIKFNSRLEQINLENGIIYVGKYL